MPDAAGTVRYYLAHRHDRLEQVRRSAARLDRDGAAGVSGELADRVVTEVYADVPRAVWPAARLSVLAQLHYLRRS